MNIVESTALLEREDGTLREVTVRCDKRDLRAWELYAKRNRLDDMTKMPLTASAFTVYNALKRTGEIEAGTTFEAFNDTLICQSDEAVEVNPTLAS